VDNSAIFLRFGHGGRAPHWYSSKVLVFFFVSPIARGTGRWGGSFGWSATNVYYIIPISSGIIKKDSDRAVRTSE